MIGWLRTRETLYLVGCVILYIHFKQYHAGGAQRYPKQTRGFCCPGHFPLAVVRLVHIRNALILFGVSVHLHFCWNIMTAEVMHSNQTTVHVFKSDHTYHTTLLGVQGVLEFVQNQVPRYCLLDIKTVYMQQYWVNAVVFFSSALIPYSI